MLENLRYDDPSIAIIKNLPSDKMSKVCERIQIELPEDSSELDDSQKRIILDAFLEEDAHSNYKDDTKINTFYKYWDYYYNIRNRECFSESDWDRVQELKQLLSPYHSLINGPDTMRKLVCLGKALWSIGDGWDEEKIWDLKGEVDFAEVNDFENYIQPYDLKSTQEHPKRFKYSFWDYGYDFQAAFYHLLLKAMYPTYEIRPMIFLVVAHKYDIVFEVETSWNTLNEGIVKVEDAFKRLNYHEENGFKYPMGWSNNRVIY